MHQVELGGLPNLGKDLTQQLAIAGFSESNSDVRQLICLSEEVGELLGAWRRYVGWARRNGDWRSVTDEWADVIITAFVTGYAIGLTSETMTTAINNKVEQIYTRGWKEREIDNG